LTEVTAIAHRGGSRLRPENTLAAFDHAAELGVDGLECDVHLSRDGEPVVIHDPTLDRTTDASGPVVERSALELARVDAGAQFGAEDGRPYRGAGLGVPLLATVLDRYRNLPIVVEIKGEDVRVAERALTVVREAGALDRVIVGGFSGVVLDAVRRLAPGIPTSASRDEVRQVIEGGASWRPAADARLKLFQAPFRFQGQQVLERTFVEAVRRAELPVHAWIVDEPEDIERVVSWGVTGIISDRPDTAVRLARKHRALR
jgi:glycerophosphoryl diester phosphodiesterase